MAPGWQRSSRKHRVGRERISFLLGLFLGLALADHVDILPRVIAWLVAV
jgi:hypothetical protein